MAFVFVCRRSWNEAKKLSIWINRINEIKHGTHLQRWCDGHGVRKQRQRFLWLHWITLHFAVERARARSRYNKLNKIENFHNLFAYCWCLFARQRLPECQIHVFVCRFVAGCTFFACYCWVTHALVPFNLHSSAIRVRVAQESCTLRNVHHYHSFRYSFSKWTARKWKQNPTKKIICGWQTFHSEPYTLAFPDGGFARFGIKIAAGGCACALIAIIVDFAFRP